MNGFRIDFPPTIKRYVLQFANLYHQYKVKQDKLHKTKYHISSSIDDFKKNGLIQLSFNDKPGDFLPPLTLLDIKKREDILIGLHPIDVNTINDLYYLTQDKFLKIAVTGDIIEAIHFDGSTKTYNVNFEFDHENNLSKRIAYLIGYMQAEKYIKAAYTVNNVKLKIIRDQITSLYIQNLETKEFFIKKPIDIIMSNEYKLFSKEDIVKISYICGQMSNIYSKESIA